LSLEKARNRQKDLDGAFAFLFRSLRTRIEHFQIQTVHAANGTFKGYIVRQLNYQFGSQNTWCANDSVL
jgi:hypothetical protein